MKTSSTWALALALGLGGAVAATPALAAKKEKAAEDAAPKQAPLKPSAKIVANDKAAQDLIKKQDWAGLTANADAIAPSIQGNDDKAVVGNYYIQAGQGAHNNAAIGKGIDLLLESGRAGANAAQMYLIQGELAFDAKDYDKAIAALQGAQKAGSTADDDIVPRLVEAYSRKGQTLVALQTLDQAVDKYQKAGKPVPQGWFPRAFTVAYQTKKDAPDYAAIRSEASQINRKWLAQENNGTVWHDVLLMYGEGHPGDVELANDTRRLMAATGGLKSANDYLEYAEAVYQKNPGEAKTVLDEGVKKGAYTYASNRNAGEINDIVSKKVAADKAALVGSEKAAATNPAARVAQSVGDGYYGYGNWAKAAEMYKLALTKQGADANLLNTRLGMALARSGDTAGAKAAFAQVQGPRKELADFWTVYLDHPPAAA